MSALEQMARQTGGLRRLDVARLVADQEASLSLDRPMFEEIDDHARRRLPPGMRRPISLDAPLRMKRAVSPVVDGRAGRGQFPRHPAVQRDDVALAIKPSGDARLVCHDEHIIAGVVETLHGLRRPGDPFDLFWRMDVAAIDVEDAVTVEKDGRTAAAARNDLRRSRERLRGADVDEDPGVRIPAQGPP